MIEEFARCGVRHAAVSPGSRSTPLAVALWRQPAIDVQVVLDERSAAFFALGTALSTRVPAVALCTSGSAAAHFHPAVAEADEASVPLIVLTADRPPELRGIGAGQTIDQLKLYGDAARWFSELGNHEADDDGLLHFRSTACRAYAASAGEPRPGPVHLNVPFRDPLAPVPVEGAVTATDPLALEGRGERPLSAVARTPQAPDPALLDELAARIASVPRGLVLAGRQPDQELAEPLCALADAAGYPVLAEPTSQLRWGPQPHSMSVPGYDLIARARPDQLEPALVLRFGDMPTSKALRQWLAAIAGLRQIVVDPAGDWKEPTRRAEMLLRADPATLAAGLTERLKAGAEARRTTPAQASGETGGAPAWLERWLDAQRRLAAGVGDELARLVEASEPGVWYAGTSPKGLFRSEDGGVTWAPVSGFNDHPEQHKWVGSDKDETPDGGKLHSILVDPRDAKHLYLSMSGGGTCESTSANQPSSSRMGLFTDSLSTSRYGHSFVRSGGTL